ncbi:uncharacterized protein LOC110020957 [Phalaenopsis equestris]|uniref:uncharacterized protein LOC110020957 n=1 Tax=Phalaenopsis equestris TaxID=78828 RepID=UPI0009E22D1D|nr:uncharacterized protein LOC110020957 [Phalaenopsis equestris]
MAANKLSTEAIALTEKKMDMTLDDIIKMSKKAPFKGKQASRTSNKNQGFLNDRVAQRNAKVQRFMNTRSAIRQGVLAQRRTNFKGNQFPLTTEVARRAAVVPIRNRAVNPSKQRVAAIPIRRNAGDGNFAGKKQTANNKQKPRTLDALFADMKEERMRTISQQQVGRGRGQAGQRRGRQNQRQRGWIGAASGSSAVRYGTQFGNSGR